MKARGFAWFVVVSLCVGAPVFAHHSQTMFDETRMVTLKGTVTKFAWINPHVKLYFDVTEQGKTQNWEIETNAASSLGRAGWKRDQFKFGDAVTVSFNPVRNGQPRGMLRKVIGPDGKELSMPGNTLPQSAQKPQ